MRQGVHFADADFDPHAYANMDGLFTEGTWNCEFAKEVQPKESDEILRGRKDFCAFEGTDLLNILQKEKIGTIVLMGFLSNICVEETSRRAKEMMPHLNVIVCSDGCAAKSQQEHDNTMMTSLSVVGINVKTCAEALISIELISNTSDKSIELISNTSDKVPKRSSMGMRISTAFTSVEEKGIMMVAATIGLVLLVVHGLTYVIARYGIFDGDASEGPAMPEKDSSSNMLSITDTFPSAKLNDYQFQIYLGFIMYVTVVLTGLGLEYLVWRMLLTGDWNEVKENRWMIAQFLFSLLTATAIGLASQGNYLALPCLVIAMWKCGFPGEILRPCNFIELIHYNKSLTLLKQLFGRFFCTIFSFKRPSF